MLYKFKSKAAGDLILLEPNARRVLGIIGKEPGPRGIILPEQMPAAIAALQAAIAAEEAMEKVRAQEALARGVELSQGDRITLRQRAVTFIDMLTRCEQAGKEIVWGV